MCAGCGWGRFCREVVPSMCFATSGCSCVCSSMRFLKLWWQIALEWLHECCTWAMFWRGSRSTKHCVFPCKVVAAGDERYLACAAVAAGVVSVAKWFLLCVLQRVVVPVCVVMRFLKLWWQIALEWLHECCTWATFWRGSRSTKPSMCFATSGCSCVRSSMRFLNLWLQIPLEWLHGCCHLALPLSVVLSCFATQSLQIAL